jgi:hypothetical protein
VIQVGTFVPGLDQVEVDISDLRGEILLGHLGVCGRSGRSVVGDRSVRGQDGLSRLLMRTEESDQMESVGTEKENPIDFNSMDKLS